MTNPFEDVDGSFVALINDEGQYSLWPTAVEEPPGWIVAYSGPSRPACLD
jgi:MbtH protein